MQKTNKDYPFICNNEIIEWDIKSANTSLMRYYQLQPDNRIDKYEAMIKAQREIAIGKLMRKDKQFAKALEQSFNRIVEEFIYTNNLTWDDIVSVKKDAIFVKNRPIPNYTFGPVHFVPKNKYKHVLLLPKYEIYIGDKVDVKGISDEKLPLHEHGMLEFFRTVMDNGSNFKALHKYLKEYVVAYKKKELEFDHYREFTSESLFRIEGPFPMLADSMIEDDVEYLNHVYNYVNVVLPTIQATF